MGMIVYKIFFFQGIRKVKDIIPAIWSKPLDYDMTGDNTFSFMTV